MPLWTRHCRLTIPRRSDRRRVHDNRTRQWAARSVWSEVCAEDLGLIVGPVTSSSECVAEPATVEERCDTIGKLSASRDSRKKSRSHRVQRTSSRSTQIRSAYFVNCVFRERSYGQRVASSPDEESSQRSQQFRSRRWRNTDPSVARKTVVYNPFNVVRNGKENHNVYERANGLENREVGERESFPGEKKYRTRDDDDSSSENDNHEKEGIPERTRSKEVRGIERIAIKRKRKHRARKLAKLVYGAREQNSHVLEKSIETDSTEKSRERPKKCHADISTASTNEKNVRKGGRKRDDVAKNDYEYSDIDESLLVDPFTDLPQSLLETIDESVDLMKPEFDVVEDLNFENDEVLSSTIETLKQDSSLASGIPTKTPRNSTSGKGQPLTRTIHFGTNALRESYKVAPEKSPCGSNNEESALDDKYQNGGEKIASARSRKTPTAAAILASASQVHPQSGCVSTVPGRRRRSADSAVIAAGKMAALCDEEQRNGRAKTTSTTEKRRRSADDGVRVTRLSTRNFIANKENSSERRAIGTVVWGNCKGWWPAFIVDPEDVGMLSLPDKTWVCWIWEYKISNLREKTQIQSFSSCLRERMIETLGSKRNSRDPCYRACLETIELINDEILKLGPLTKPYDAWAEKHLTSLENIDRLILHPYPLNVKPRLDDLKRANHKASEKYLSELKEQAEKAALSSTKISSSVKNVTAKNTLAVPVAGHLPLMKQKAGVIAWAKIAGQVWWPAIIVDYRDCGMKEPSFGCQWIVWYGDNTMSQVNHRFFLYFEKGISLMKEYARNCRRECYRRGVLDAARDYCSRYGYKAENWGIDEIYAWFETSDEENSSPSSRPANNSLPGIPGNSEIPQRYPSGIVEALRKYRSNCTVAAAREHAIRESDIVGRVEACGLKIEETCLMCLRDCTGDEYSIEHPFFVGKLCERCSEKYKPTIFAYGEDGKCFFCTICAGSDTVVMCDRDDCPRVYCTACIKYLVAPKFYEDIMLKDPWLCFVCDMSGIFTKNGFLKPRHGASDRVARLFRSNVDSVARHLELYNKREKRKIRVLSLFDGISAGLVVLKKLGIEIEAYYASEIDPDAEMVSSAHHGREVERLGDVRSISEEKIRGILPIDLLIGGSPCNDLSLVNPLRLGLHDPNGTGVLFFEYCRIKNLLEIINGEHFFWLFENVAAMPSKYRLEINEHLGREPELIDSANYSPQHRPRLYWSNLPIVSFPLSNQDLEDVLTPNCNRHALVKKIRTVTTRVNSLRQGRDALKPILMNETNDTLWITELEEIFGFPKHYTDVKNLCATKRQKLIAMSWSVQTIVEIMRPLCNFFSTRNDEST